VRKLDMTVEERVAKERERHRLKSQQYRQRHPDKIAEYKQRPATKAREAAHMRSVRKTWTEERKTAERRNYRREHLRRLYGIAPGQANRIESPPAAFAL
jgi:transketolase